MPRKRDPVWAHFMEIEEQYKEEPTGETKARVKCKLGKRSGCAHVKDAALAVEANYGEFASRPTYFQPACTQKNFTSMYDDL